MNFYNALNQGDATLREPHLTSILFYLIKETQIKYPENNLLDFLINEYLPGFPKSIECEFDIEVDLKIEEILSLENCRRDTDITIYLKNTSKNKLINIENKISNASFLHGQVEEQSRILKNKYPNFEIQNILLLPFQSEKHIEINTDAKLIYWVGENESLISSLIVYLNSLIEKQNNNTESVNKLIPWVEFFQFFGGSLEQEQLSSESSLRGPKNKYPQTMHQYLSQIAVEWETHFENPETVLVTQLLDKFEEIVSNSLEVSYPNSFEEMIKKFKKGALEAQPKIMTINEKNRIHFGITSPNEKCLFYYPDFPNGDYTGKWKNTRIKPLNRMTENSEYIIFWKNELTNELETSIYDE